MRLSCHGSMWECSCPYLPLPVALQTVCMEYAAPRARWTVHDGTFTAPGTMRIVHKTRMQLPPSPPEPSVLQT